MLPSFDELWKINEGWWSMYGIGPTGHRQLYDVALTLNGPLTIVELGVYAGATANLLCSIARATGGSYLGIDTFEMQPEAHAGNVATRERIIEHWQKHGLLAWGDVVVGDAGAYPFNKPIDLLFIDDGHDYAHVDPQSRLWTPRVRIGGYVIYDDYCDAPLDHPHGGVKPCADRDTAGWEITVKPDRFFARRLQ